jgi:predicted AAA+ superfamily ATPase
MIERALGKKLKELATKYPVVTLTGPRQSGKSTLLKALFADYRYVSLEDPDMREFSNSDPRGFLASFDDKVIIDEAQRNPQLFSYIQTHVDERGNNGMYLLAGSHNFLLMQSISQSLAGRTAVLRLLPFSHSEMKQGQILPDNADAEIYNGAYPRLYDKNIQPQDFYPYYIQTYVERDVRLVKNIGDISRFIRFIKLCAGRIGQLLNMSSLANECGISVPTAQSWISVLEASYIVYLLKPDFNNFSKRLIKTPKLYFYDTGLACSLLDIKSPEQVAYHFLRGGLFENLVINEFVKRGYNQGGNYDIAFWRNSVGDEVDLLFRDNAMQQAYEIKSGATFSSDYFKGLKKWAALSNTPKDNCHVVYNGDNGLTTSYGNVLCWKDF